ncbi:thioesterase [Vibrio sp. S9_S30]|uniref:thioesterase II family protein n=1 Tax=Vibrio sp. S9_S30 TaxID=2720226 RepID=UPI001680AF1B|nr:alpha/beta fold hydrolase [Vibrio sp. S9_S30]MBD1556477.1 thioesterase [Vibrio sp. S9_S30]
MRGNTSLNRWFAIPKPKPNAPLRLICLPYAGGNISSFVPYSSLQELTAEICAVQLPGKGSRLIETPYQSMEALVQDLAEALAPLTDKPYVIWGHSFGARIGFELLRYLKMHGMPMPAHFIPAASRAPHQLNTQSPIHGLSDEGFKAKLKAMGGTPDEILEHDELMSLLMPSLKADFKLAETHKVNTIEQFNIPVTLLGGTMDSIIPPDSLSSWQAHFCGDFELTLIEGDHFFIDKQFDSVSKKLTDIIQRLVEKE